VPVEKARGRQILEEVERRRVDPALLEQTQGNNFQLRVFPIPAQGTRTVEVTYTEALGREGANWVYRLPLAYGELAQGIALHVTVAGAAAPQASGSIGDIVFDRSGDGYAAQLTRASYSACGTLKLLAPASAQPQTYVQQFDGATYFLAEIPVAVQRTPRVLPKVLGLLWDSSGSGANRQRDPELLELDRYFKALGNAEVRLIRLRDRAEAVQRFRILGYRLLQAGQPELAIPVFEKVRELAEEEPQSFRDLGLAYAAGSRQQLVAGATTLQLKLTSGFGRPGARDQMVTLRLEGQGQTVLVGEFEVSGQ
jgi:Ca-activated chloride channel family protein